MHCIYHRCITSMLHTRMPTCPKLLLPHLRPTGGHDTCIACSAEVYFKLPPARVGVRPHLWHERMECTRQARRTKRSIQARQPLQAALQQPRQRQHSIRIAPVPQRLVLQHQGQQLAQLGGAQVRAGGGGERGNGLCGVARQQWLAQRVELEQQVQLRGQRGTCTRNRNGE